IDVKRINNKIKKFWGVSDIGFSFMSAVDTAFFVIFLTDVSKLPLPIVATLITITGTVDILTSLLSGIIVDKVNLKKGKYRPWLIYCPPIVIASFMLMFSKIGSDLTAALICGVGYIISHGVWNIAWAANRTLVTVLTDDGKERAFLSARVSAGSSAGRMIAGYLVPTLSLFFLGLFSNSKSDVIGYTMTALVASILYAIFYGVHYFITKGYDEQELNNKNKLTTVSPSIKDIFTTVISNTQLLAIIVYDILKLIPFYMIAASVAYYCKVVLGDPTSVALLLVPFNFGTFIGCMLSNCAVRKFGSKNTNYLGIGGFIICHLIGYFLPTNIIVIMIVLGLGQIFFGMAHGNTTNLYSMCGTYSEYKTGKSIKAMVMALCNTSIKICLVFRGLVITAVLGFINYNPDALITDMTIRGIKNMFFLVPVGFLIISLIPLLWFKIKDKDIEVMESEMVRN
ncbi:MAG: MFS transporter, partial [Romboutsia sp.]|uniref:MFS transporter n=1 Tax=Romboutsia sp. TaxID=1965302 RepID=UPI003F2E50AC